MLGDQPAWIIGIIIGAGVSLTIFVVIPTLIRWIWHSDPLNEVWKEPRADDE